MSAPTTRRSPFAGSIVILLALWSLASAPTFAQTGGYCPLPGNPCGGGDSASQSSTNGVTGVGNPIDVVSGNKYQLETDVAWDGDLAVNFRRHYNSVDAVPRTLGRGWSHSFDTRLTRERRGEQVSITVTQGDGRVITFRPEASARDGILRFVSQPAGYGVIEERQVDIEHLRAGRRNAVGVVSEEPNRLRPWQWRWLDGRSLAFDGSGHVRRIGNPTGDWLDLDYDVNARVREVRDALGRRLILAYWDDSADTLTTYGGEKNSAARLLGVRGFLKSLTTPDGGVIRYGYDAERMLSRVRYPDGTETHYEYLQVAGVPRLARIVGRDNRVLGRYEYEASGRATASITAGEVDRVDIQYRFAAKPGEANETWVRNGKQEVSVYRWRLEARTGQPLMLEAFGPGCEGCAPTNLRNVFGQGGALLRTEFFEPAPAEATRRRMVSFESITRDELGRVKVRRTGAPGRRDQQVTYEYGENDIAERPVVIDSPSVIEGRRSVTRIAYTPAGAVRSVEESGFAPRIDATGASSAAPISRRIAIDYFPVDAGHALAGKMRSVDGPLPGAEDTLRFEVKGDGASRVVTMRLPLGLAQRATYDELGRLVARDSDFAPPQTIQYYASTDRYGAAPLPLAVDSSNASSTFAYDALGRLDRQTEADGFTRQFLYGKTGLPTGYSDSFGQTFERAQSASDAPRSAVFDGVERIDAGNGATTLRYHDDFGRLVVELSPDRGRVDFTYDAGDRLIARVDADGRITRYRYDLLNRMLAREEQSGAVTVRTEAEYRGGDLSKVTDQNQVTEYEFDAAHRLTKRRETLRLLAGSSQSFERSFAYDAQSRVTEERLPDGSRLAYEYAAMGARVTRVSLYPRGGEKVLLFGDGAKKRGAHEEHRRGDKVIESIDRDPSGRVVSMGVKRLGVAAPAQSLWRKDLEYGTAGELTRSRVDAADLRLTHDDDGRLVEVAGEHAETFQYDAAGNRLSASNDGHAQTLSYLPGTNRLQSVDDAGVSYDAAGRPMSVGAREFKYGLNGRLSEVREGTTSVEYAYNGFGERVSRKSGNEVEYYLYGEGKIVATIDAAGHIKAQFVYRGDAPVTRLDYVKDGKAEALPPQSSWMESGKRIFGMSAHARVTQIHSDERGLPHLATDVDGKIVWAARYSAFGRAEVAPGSSVDIPQRFAGQFVDAGTGIHYNYLRDYDPDTGRYLTPDPIGVDGGANLYSYVDNRPLTAIDPLGLMIDPDDSSPAPWLFGTYVHNVAWGAQIRAFGPGWGANDGRSGTWAAVRPDAYFVDPINRSLEASGSKFVGTLWELKPISWASGPQRAAAVTQVAGYMASATRGCWTPGLSSAMTSLIKPFPLFFGGRLYNIFWEPDAIDASGLVYYTKTATTNPVPMPVTVPAPEQKPRTVPVPSTGESVLDRWIDNLVDALKWIGMAILEIIKWILILIAIVVAVIAACLIVSAAAAETAVAAIIMGIAFMIDQMRGGGVSGEEGMSALTGREA